MQAKSAHSYASRRLVGGRPRWPPGRSGKCTVLPRHVLHAVVPRQAERRIKSSRDRAIEPSPPSSVPTGRIITFAVDGTPDAQESCQWFTNQIVRPGDYVHLCNVVCNERSLPTAVGMTTSDKGDELLVSYDDDFGMSCKGEYILRKEREAQLMMEERFQPILNRAGVRSDATVLVVGGQRSAATIAESIVNRAHTAGSGMLVVTSHGGGLKCDYGSVARYCVQHFTGAVLLVPPAVSSLQVVNSPSVAVAVNTLSELQDATTWTVRNVISDKDCVRVLRAEEEVMQSSSSNDQTSIMLGLQEQLRRHKVKNMEFLQLDTDLPEGCTQEQRNARTADAVLQNVQLIGDKMLVMVNYASRGMMQEMMFGTLAMKCSRKAPIPLALIPPATAQS